MNEELILKYIPAQVKGEETETSHTLTADSDISAHRYYELAQRRMEDVNHWGDICGKLSSSFSLMDEYGNPFSGTAAEGLYIRIDVPGPGTEQGKGYDWVLIEKVEGHVLNNEQELFFIQARPAANPQEDNNKTAHFLQNDATSSFTLVRDGNELKATVYGRNEIPNTKETENIIDKVRNAIVGSSGALGISKLQWKALVKAVLEVEDK